MFLKIIVHYLLQFIINLFPFRKGITSTFLPLIKIFNMEACENLVCFFFIHRIPQLPLCLLVNRELCLLGFRFRENLTESQFI